MMSSTYPHPSLSTLRAQTPFEKADKNGNVRFLSTSWTLVSESASLLLMHWRVLIYSFDVHLYP